MQGGDERFLKAPLFNAFYVLVNLDSGTGRAVLDKAKAQVTVQVA
jgi:hypothetical protein